MRNLNYKVLILSYSTVNNLLNVQGDLFNSSSPSGVLNRKEASKIGRLYFHNCNWFQNAFRENVKRV